MSIFDNFLALGGFTLSQVIRYVHLQIFTQFSQKMNISEQSVTYESFDVPIRLYCLDLLTGWNWIEQAVYPPDMIFLGTILFSSKLILINSR